MPSLARGSHSLKLFNSAGGTPVATCGAHVHRFQPQASTLNATVCVFNPRSDVKKAQLAGMAAIDSADRVHRVRDILDSVWPTARRPLAPFVVTGLDILDGLHDCLAAAIPNSSHGDGLDEWPLELPHSETGVIPVDLDPQKMSRCEAYKMNRQGRHGPLDLATFQDHWLDFPMIVLTGAFLNTATCLRFKDCWVLVFEDSWVSASGPPPADQTSCAHTRMRTWCLRLRFCGMAKHVCVFINMLMLIQCIPFPSFARLIQSFGPLEWLCPRPCSLHFCNFRGRVSSCFHRPTPAVPCFLADLGCIRAGHPAKATVCDRSP